MKKIGALVIVFSVLFTMIIAPIFGLTGSVNSVSTNFDLYTNNGSTLTCQIQVTALKPRIDNADSEWHGPNDTPQGKYNTTIAQDFVVMVRMANNTSLDLRANVGYFSFGVPTSLASSNMTSPTSIGTTIHDLSGNLFDSFTSLSTGATYQFRWASQFTYNSGLVIPAKSVLYGTFVITQYYYVYSVVGVTEPTSRYYKVDSISLAHPTSAEINNITEFTLMNADYNSIEENELLESIYQQLLSFYSMTNNRLTTTNNTLNTFSTNNHTDLVQIHNDLQAILDAYTTNASNVTETQDNIDTVNSNEQQLHTAEQNFYQQNEQALNNVGLSNFSFSSDQSSGLGSVITDFTTLWNNIGPLQIIFTFTLSMSLATFLLRHKPVTGAIKKSQQK